MRLKIFTFTCAIAAMLMSIPVSAENHKGETSVGLRGGFTTTHNAPVAGLYFQYRFSEHFRISPSIDYYFKHQRTDAFSFNINADIPVAIGQSRRFNIYPIVGINLTSWNYRPNNTNSEHNNDSSTRKNRFGINLGAGAEYYVTPTLKLAVEGKYGWVRHYDGGIFTLSIGYIF